VVVLVSQETRPLNDGWLQSLTAPLFENSTLSTVHGRILADTSMPPYPRGLINARAHLSGSQRLQYSAPSEGPGALALPSTNVAISRELWRRLSDANAPARRALRDLYGAGFLKLYVPEASAVLGGAPPAGLVDSPPAGRDDSRGLLGGLFAESCAAARELFELSERGDLPSGDRGEAYALSLMTHLNRASALLRG